MEDLKNRNFIMDDGSMKPTEIKAALSTLARFHAFSILLENHLGKTLNYFYPELFKEKSFTDKKYSKSLKFSSDQ